MGAKTSRARAPVRRSQRRRGLDLAMSRQFSQTDERRHGGGPISARASKPWKVHSARVHASSGPSDFALRSAPTCPTHVHELELEVVLDLSTCCRVRRLTTGTRRSPDPSISIARTTKGCVVADLDSHGHGQLDSLRGSRQCLPPSRPAETAPFGQACKPPKADLRQPSCDPGAASTLARCSIDPLLRGRTSLTTSTNTQHGSTAVCLETPIAPPTPDLEARELELRKPWACACDMYRHRIRGSAVPASARSAFSSESAELYRIGQH